jgi:hypothetical protein
MITSTNNIDTLVHAKAVRFDKNIIIITLSDEREVSLPVDQMNWLKWLEQATPAQRAKWTIEPGGFAIYWEELDDGIEIQHLLSMQSLG